jgi:hypothetical protein
VSAAGTAVASPPQTNPAQGNGQASFQPAKCP